MIKFYQQYDRLRLKDQSNYVYEEIASGIYRIIKNRFLANSHYASADEVVLTLKTVDRIAVFGKDKVFANFELEEFY